MKLFLNNLLFKTLNFKNEPKFVRNLCLSQTNLFQNQRYEPKFRTNPSVERSDRHPYNSLFEWTSMKQFVGHLTDNIVYFDGKLLAISKPWGVGTYKPSINITDKNRHLSESLYSGSAKYCIKESLDLLSQTLDVKRLKVIKTINRFMSGIVLLVTNDLTENQVLKALRRSQAMEAPAMDFWCVTKGWPIIDNNYVKERVGIKLLELDELGDHKQPIIISAHDLTNSMRRRKKPQSDGMVVKPALIELKTIKTNKTLGVALVQLSTNVLKWNFIECYLAFKTSFVLGDIRFSRQLKHVLGTPLSVLPNKINFNEDIEPLSHNICRKLLVESNGHIPIHIHHKRIVLPLYLSRKDKKDLVIETNKIPDHFNWTLNRLDIQND